MRISRERPKSRLTNLYRDRLRSKILRAVPFPHWAGALFLVLSPSQVRYPSFKPLAQRSLKNARQTGWMCLTRCLTRCQLLHKSFIGRSPPFRPLALAVSEVQHSSDHTGSTCSPAQLVQKSRTLRHKAPARLPVGD